MNIEITKMSSRGQVVIPQNIRQDRSIKDGERFLVYDLDDSIVLKRVKSLQRIRSMDEFERVFSSMWRTAKARNITRSDIANEIKAVRKQNA